MPLTPDRFHARLERDGTARNYFLFGEEPLQLREMADALRTHVRAAGIEERLVFDAEQSGDWEALAAASQALSLFATRRLLELRLGQRNPDKRGQDVLESLLARPGDDDILLVLGGAIESRARQSRWFKLLEQHTICAQAREPETRQLPAWLTARAARAGKNLTPPAAELVAERVEGNLLAGAQEVEKLCLLVAERDIDAAAVMQAVTDSARFDVHQLTEALVAGDPGRALRIVRGLREEGSEMPLLTWVLGRELRQLATMRRAIARGQPVARVLDEHRVWQQRKAAVRQCLERHSEDELLALLAYANRLDAAAKGGRDGAPWDDIEMLVLAWCGDPTGQALMTASE